jgi:hypothetical protein
MSGLDWYGELNSCQSWRRAATVTLNPSSPLSMISLFKMKLRAPAVWAQSIRSTTLISFLPGV